MKKLVFLIIMAALGLSGMAQQYTVYATAAGVVKPLPNGQAVTVTAGAGGTAGQIQYNNSGLLGGFAVSGDAALNTSTGVLTIATGVVTNAKLADMPTLTVKGNSSGSTGPPGDLTASQTKTLLAIVLADISDAGTIASQDANAVAISGGTITGAAVTGLANGVNPTDAVNFAQLSGVSAGITQRTGCAVATTANLTLSGEQTVDGILTSASRILVKDQTATEENGIYVTGAGAWARAADSNTAAELLVGYYYFVTAGTAQSGTGWTIQTAPTILGSDPVVFQQFSASQVYSAGAGITFVGNQITNAGVRSLAGTAGEITASSPTGALTISLPAALTFTGKTVTGGTYVSGAFNGSIGATTPAAGTFNRSTVNVTPDTAGYILSNGGIARWLIYPSGTESGSNAGSNMQWLSYTDAGAQVGVSMIATRATGKVSFPIGLENTPIGAATPAAATFTTVASSSNANIRTTKANFHVIVNVKDYGAVGDGSTNDQAAIASACAAMTSYTALYFPPGNYRVTSGIYSFASISHFSIFGEGATITNDSGSAGANTFVFEHTCSDVEVRDLRFYGTATVRGSGIHLRSYCSNVRISNCYFTKCSDFAVHISNDTGDTTTSDNIIVEGCTFYDTLGDGLHVSSATNVSITGNVFQNTGDDSIGIVRDSLTASGVPSRITIVGNVINRSGYGTAGVSGMGIRIAEANDVLVSGNIIDYTYQAPIVVERYLSTSAFNTRIQIVGNKVTNGNQLAGQLGSIGVSFCNGVTIADNKIDDAANGNGIAFLDCNDLVIQGNHLRNIPSRGIGSDDGTTTNVAANCYRVWILNNSVLYTLANQAIYCVAPTGKTINDFVIAGNNAGAVPAGNYIYYDRVTNGKVYNNLQLAANTVGAGGTVSSVTTGNNN